MKFATKISRIIKKIKGNKMQKIVWQNNEFDGVKVAKLFEGKNSKEIRINLQKGAIMKEHQAPGDIMVQILRGRVEFSVESEVVILDELDMIALDANVKHALLACEDSVIRLSLSKNDDVSRVFGVLKS